MIYRKQNRRKNRKKEEREEKTTEDFFVCLNFICFLQFGCVVLMLLAKVLQLVALGERKSLENLIRFHSRSNQMF